MNHGGHHHSPSALCECQHVFSVHRPGPCNVASGCECQGFVEQQHTPVARFWGHQVNAPKRWTGARATRDPDS